MRGFAGLHEKGPLLSDPAQADFSERGESLKKDGTSAMEMRILAIIGLPPP